MQTNQIHGIASLFALQSLIDQPTCWCNMSVTFQALSFSKNFFRLNVLIESHDFWLIRFSQRKKRILKRLLSRQICAVPDLCCIVTWRLVKSDGGVFDPVVSSASTTYLPTSSRVCGMALAMVMS